MPRPRKHRIVSSMPSSEGFAPFGYGDEDADSRPTVVMTVEEYETIRLIDYLGLTQEACAARMQVSRPTVTNIYESARYKLSDALVNEKKLLIGGGNFAISTENIKTAVTEDLPVSFQIAVTYEDGLVFQHFGHCQTFKLYRIKDRQIVSSSLIDAGSYTRGALSGFLKMTGADVLICGGIGSGAQHALTDAGITFFSGVTGSADNAAEALLSGTLVYNSSPSCENQNSNHCHDIDHTSDCRNRHHER